MDTPKANPKSARRKRRSTEGATPPAGEQKTTPSNSTQTANDLTERVREEPALQPAGLLAAIVESSDDAIISKNLNGVITSWNTSAEQMFGHSAREAVGQHITLIIPPDRREEENDILRRIRRGERVDHFETVRMRKDGSRLQVSVTISPVKDADGKIVGASKVARDITARRAAEETLADRVRQQKALFHLADQLHRAQSLEDIYKAGLDAILRGLHCDRASILLCDEGGTMRFVSWRGLSEDYRKATDGHSPWRAGEANPTVICMNNVDQAKLDDSLRAAIQSEGIAALTFIPLVSRGEVIGKFMTYFNEPHTFTDEEVALSLAIARQMAFAIARKRADEALRASEERFRQLSETLDAEVRARTKELELRNAQLLESSERLRDLSRRMMRVQDEERRHIARELHDSAGQLLAVLGINVGQLAQQVQPELAPAAQEIQEAVKQLTQELRTMSYLLHPPLLDEIGLAAALNWYVQGVKERSHIDIQLDVSENLGRLPPEMELILFRLVQESLTNIHRHSESKIAAIRLMRDDQTVSLEVQDQGKGISREKLADIQMQGSGVGIQGMYERVRQYWGEMTIESDHSGTRILVRLPVHPKLGIRPGIEPNPLHAAS